MLTRLSLISIWIVFCCQDRPVYGQVELFDRLDSTPKDTNLIRIETLSHLARNDNSVAQLHLYHHLRKDSKPNESKEQQLQRLKDAVHWLDRSIANRNTMAMRTAARMYEIGDGVKPNLESAFAWYLKSAEKEDTVAISKVIEFYEQGIGTTQSSEKAEEWRATLKEVYEHEYLLKLENLLREDLRNVKSQGLVKIRVERENFEKKTVARGSIVLTTKVIGAIKNISFEDDEKFSQVERDEIRLVLGGKQLPPPPMHPLLEDPFEVGLGFPLWEEMVSFVEFEQYQIDIAERIEKQGLKLKGTEKEEKANYGLQFIDVGRQTTFHMDFYPYGAHFKKSPAHMVLRFTLKANRRTHEYMGSVVREWVTNRMDLEDDGQNGFRVRSIVHEADLKNQSRIDYFFETYRIMANQGAEEAKKTTSRSLEESYADGFDLRSVEKTFLKSARDAISIQWVAHVKKTPPAAKYGFENARITITAEGKIAKIEFSEGTSNIELQTILRTSIEKAEIPPMPAGLVKSLKDGTLSFEFEALLY